MQLYSLLLHKILWAKFYRADERWLKDNGEGVNLLHEGPAKETKTTLYLKKVLEAGLQKQ